MQPPGPPAAPVRFPVVVRRRGSTRAVVTVVTVVLGVGSLVAAHAAVTGQTRHPLSGGGWAALAVPVVCFLVLLQVTLFRVVIHPDRVAVRGLSGAAVLPVAGLLRVERTHVSRRSTMPFPTVRPSGTTRTIIGRTAAGRTRRATINDQLCDTSASDPAIDALLRQLLHLDAAVQGPDVPWVRWWDRPLGRSSGPVEPWAGGQQGWGPASAGPDPRCGGFWDTRGGPEDTRGGPGAPPRRS